MKLVAIVVVLVVPACVDEATEPSIECIDAHASEMDARDLPVCPVLGCTVPQCTDLGCFCNGMACVPTGIPVPSEVRQ